MVYFDDPFEDEHQQSLWTYGSPGDRFFLNWSADDTEQAGQLQIDIAQANPYTPADLEVSDETFTAPGGVTFQVTAYSREAMLAAKVSWLVRSLNRTADGRVVWAGEPKDLFDAHLLASDATLRPEVFRRAMLAVGTGDGLNWNALDVLFDVRRVTVTDDDFGNWGAFARRHPKLARSGPVALWAELVDRLEPLFGDLCPLAEMPFLAAVNARPEDVLPMLVYADWLDERSDPRGLVLRLIAEAITDGELSEELATALRGASQPWLHQVFGTSVRFHAFRAMHGS